MSRPAAPNATEAQSSTSGMVTYQYLLERDSFLREHKPWLDQLMTRCNQDAFTNRVYRYINRGTARVLPPEYKDKLYYWFERRRDAEGMEWCQQADDCGVVVE